MIILCRYTVFVKSVKKKKTTKKKEKLLIFENKYIQQRIEKANALKDAGYNPYDNVSNRNTTIEKYLNVNSDIAETENKRDENRHYIVSGRIKFLRIMGKASFAKIEDESGILQIYVSRDNLPEGFYNTMFKKNIEVGDIIEIGGFPFVTGQGELSLHVDSLKLLTKAIAPLPEKFRGITDK